MFSRNESNTDRALRAILGAALIIAFFTVQGAAFGWVLLVLGLIAVGTAAVGFCPLYRLVGVSTCAMK